MTDEARLQRWLDSRREMDAPRMSTAHIDVEMLGLYAAGQLAPEHARLVREHIADCEDGRCREHLLSQKVNFDVAKIADRKPLTPGEPVRRRTFQSRQGLWSAFESMAREQHVSVDELVNDAMAAYAHARGYDVQYASSARLSKREPRAESHPFDETLDAASISPLDRSYMPSGSRVGFDEDGLERTATRGAISRPELRKLRRRDAAPSAFSDTVSRVASKASSNASGAAGVAGAPSAVAMRAANSTGSSGQLRTSRMPPPLPPQQLTPSTRSHDARRASEPLDAKTLALVYQGRSYDVHKDRYLIGRGKTQADLRLDDPNVSRQHAAIERVGATWYLVDLGSTNGVHVSGERVQRRPISDGDVIVITVHEIRCELR